MLCLWSAQGGSSHLYIGLVSPSYLATKPIKESKTIKLIELTWMSLYGEMFPQVTFKIFLTTSWTSNHLRIMAVFLNGVSNWSQFACFIHHNKTSTFPALGLQFKSCWLFQGGSRIFFLSFFLFSCFGFFPFLTYFLSVWRFFEKCISTIKIDWLYRKSSKVLKFFERNFFKNFWKKSGVGPEKTADIILVILPLVSPPHDVWNERRNSILMTRHYPELGSAPDWLCRMGNLIQPMRSTTQIWVIWRGNQW